MTEKKQANVTAWADKLDHYVTLCLSNNDLRATVHLTPERARFLMAEVQQAIDSLPATVTAADLGIEGAPV